MVMYCDICGAKIENGDVVNECPECLCPFENVDKNSPIKEFKSQIPDGNIVKKISTDESFMNAMIKLYKEDPVEYQLKISQFKTQLAQQESSKSQNDNTPKCPTCGSTNIKKISGLSKAGSVAMWGIFSRKVHKQWHCDACGSEW